MIHLCLKSRIFIHHVKLGSLKRRSSLHYLHSTPPPRPWLFVSRENLKFWQKALCRRKIIFYQRFSSFLSSSRYFLKLQYFVLFYLFAFLHVIVLLEIIITFYAFNNFPFPAISRISPNMNSSRFSLSLPLRSRFGGNANEMKILRKINFFHANFSHFNLAMGKALLLLFRAP